MSQLSNRKVRQHLEKLGYRNIPPDELQNFTRDLQRLVNYETSSRSGTETSTYSRGPGRGGQHRPELESIPEHGSQAGSRARCRSQAAGRYRPPHGTQDFFNRAGVRCPPTRRSQSVDDRSDSYDESLERTMRDLVSIAQEEDGDECPSSTSATDTSACLPPPQPAAARQDWLPTIRPGADEMLRAGVRVTSQMLSQPIRSSAASRHRWYKEFWKRFPVPGQDSHWNIRRAVRVAMDTYDYKPRPMPKTTDMWQPPLMRMQPDATYRLNYDSNVNRFPLNTGKQC